MTRPSYGFKTLSCVCCKCHRKYRSAVKDPKYGRCPGCDEEVAKISSAYQWMHSGGRQKRDMRGGYG